MSNQFLDEKHFIALFFSDYSEIVSQRQFRIWNHKLPVWDQSSFSHKIRDLAALDQSGNKEVRVFCKDFMDFVEFFFLKLACASVTRALETELETRGTLREFFELLQCTVEVRWGFFFFFLRIWLNFLFLRAVVNIPIQTLIISLSCCLGCLWYTSNFALFLANTLASSESVGRIAENMKIAALENLTNLQTTRSSFPNLGPFI